MMAGDGGPKILLRKKRKMKIHILPKTGIQEAEKYAVDRIEKAFPKEWRGYASLEVIQRGGLAREIDLVLLLPDRVLLVELKRWNGQIKSEDGYWHVKKPHQSSYERRDVSPVKKNKDKERIVKSIIERTIKNGRGIFVDGRVVLCGNSPSPMLTEEEKPYVLQLEEFLKIADPQAYKRILPLPQEFQGKWKPINPLDQTEFELLFKRSPQHIRAREFSWQNYKVDGPPIFKHPEGLYQEYKSVNQDDPNARALLRRWDFSQLGATAPTQGDWVNIALREPKVFSYVKGKTDELDGVMLQPIGTVAADEVTVDHCELFDLPTKQKRLIDFIEAYRDKLPLTDRVSLTKVLISKFAELHRLGVAHRDIGDHCVWLERPASVRLSGFVAAYFPQMETVGAIREKVSCIAEKLPEDFFEDKYANAFHRDVYLLGVVAHLLIFGNEPDRDADGLVTWSPPSDDPTGGKLDEWFERSLKWETRERWSNAVEMLDALNDIELSEGQPVLPLSAFDYFKALTKVRDYEEIEEPIEKDNLEVFIGAREGTKCQVKFWFGAVPDPDKPEFNHGLLRFLEKAKAIQVNPSEWLPKVVDVGLVQKKGLLYAREWLDLPTLSDWKPTTHSQEERIHLCLSLIAGLERLHSINLPHGDLHPGNILVRPPGEGRSFSRVVFIDTPDFKDGSEEVVTPAYAPANYERISIVERDRYAAAILVAEILGASKQIPVTGDLPIFKVYEALEECLLAEPAILTLGSLKVALELELAPTAPELAEIVVTLKRPPANVKMGVMLPDNGVYYVESASNNRIYIAAPGLQLRLVVDKDNETVRNVGVEPLTHIIFQRKANKGIPFEARIVLKEGPIDDAQSLYTALLDNPVTAQKFSSSEPEEELWDYSGEESDAPKQRSTVKTSAIWRNLIEAEFDAQPEIVVTAFSRPHPKRGDIYLVPFKSSLTLEYAPDEEVDVLKELDTGEYKRVARLEHRYSTADELALVSKGFSPEFPIGARYMLRSKAERSSYERRYDAVDRVLSGRSVIGDLVEYFERNIRADKALRYPEPSDADLEAYDIYEGEKKVFSLNEDQKNAFKRISSYGPVCLLQGPPGTGKTSFIAAFLHYVIQKQGAQSILLVSQSHEATNNALEGVLRLADRTGLALDVVRVGEDGSLSEPVKHVGVSALQESYRERFRSELKHRVMTLSSRLGLKQEFVGEYVDVMANLNQLSADIASFEADLHTKDDEEETSAIRQRLFSRKERLKSIAASVTDVSEIDDVDSIVSAVRGTLVTKHNVRNPAAAEKLHQLVKISQEWVEVLGSQGGNFEEFLARTRTVVAGTCVGVGRWNLGVSRNAYDWIVIDEAARASPSELAVSMQVGKRILLVGDHFQLPPLYKDELRRQMSKRLPVGPEADVFDSDFERAFESPYGQTVGAALLTQYRMAPQICSLVSKSFYEPRGKKLEQGRDNPKQYFDTLEPPFDSEVVWVDTSNAGKQSHHTRVNKSSSNAYEARAVVDVLRHLLGNEAFATSLLDDIQPKEIPIGIIAMYSAQVAEINNAIAKAEWLGAMRQLVKVDTVDSYQGKENRIVIVSLVRHNPQREQGFLSSPNRLNVAMSRAMDRLVVVGAMTMWKDRNNESPLGVFVRHFEQAKASGLVSAIDAENLRK
jgi:serine/threonine protein kinase